MPADSLLPRKNKPSGTGFLVAAIVMLILMGGLITWKLSQDDEPGVAPTESAAVPEPSRAPTLEAPPPPPPPVEEPDGGNKDAGAEKPRRASIAGACEAECKGTASSQLRSALAARGGQARGCYERVLRTNAGLEGRLLVSARVGPSGQVCSLRVADQGLGDQGVANCVQRMFQTGGFPPPAGGCVDVQVPLNFVQKR
jgi:hypothetical protein